MYSRTELRQLITDISDRTSQTSASSQERLASCRHLLSTDAEVKAVTKEAITASSEILGRIRK